MGECKFFLTRSGDWEPLGQRPEIVFFLFIQFPSFRHFLPNFNITLIFFQGLPASSPLMPEDLSSHVPEVHVWNGVWLQLLKKTADQM